MANFDSILSRTLNFEGGWVNDPEDAGGETYAGISRRYSKSWVGWNVIDALKHERSDIRAFRKALAASTDLQHLVAEFYREKYWLPIRGEQIGNQKIAEKLFDCAVNMGVQRATKMLQEALNHLAAETCVPLAVDGELGPMTLTALDRLLREVQGESDLIRLYSLLRGERYLRLISKTPSQRKFLRGWLRRLD